MSAKTIVTLFAVILCFLNLQAQVEDLFKQRLEKNGYVSFAKIKKGKSETARVDSDAVIKEVIGTKENISFLKMSLTDFSKMDIKIQQEKYQLYKNGIKLRGGEYVLNFVNDTAMFVHGFMAPVSDESFIYDSENAIASALTHFNRFHNILDTTDQLSGKSHEAVQIYYYDNAARTFRASWQVRITSKNFVLSENIFINAATGAFLGAESLICSINFNGTGSTQYSGQKSIVTDAPSSAGPFRLQETRNNALIRTRNMNYLPDLFDVTDFTDNDNNWTVAEHGDDIAALDAHWGAERVFDYWRTVQNRIGLNGNPNQPVAMESYVHWQRENEPWTFQAQWNGTAVYYGDGFGGASPLTSLDICAHEFGHGVDLYTGNLAYNMESGALDEGFADIWAASVEAWAAPTKSKWLIAEDIIGGPIRNMANPNVSGQPDTYLGINWVNQEGCVPSSNNDACGIHINSGVLNYWYYLTSQGGTGTNDIGDTYNVIGIGITTAEKIAYATKLLMNTSSADYEICRELSIQAATNLYGQHSCQVKAVTDAWYAVGLGDPYDGTLGLSIGGTFQICNSAVVFNVSNAPNNSTISWQSSNPNGLTINSTTGQATRQNNFNGNVVVSANINIGCGSIPLTKNVWVGPTYGGLALDGSNLCCDYWRYVETGSHTFSVSRFGKNASGQNANVNIRITRSAGGTSFPPTYYNSTAANVNYTWLIPPHHYGETYNFYVTSSNGCGSTWTRAATVTTDGSIIPPIAIVAYPNPASTQLTIQLSGTANEGASIDQPYRLELFSEGSLKSIHSVTSSEREIHIPVDKLSNGIYYLNIHYKGIVIKEQIIVKR